MNWDSLLQHSLLAGFVLSAVLTILIIISLKINREIYYSDYPKDVQEFWGPMSEKARRQRMVLVPIFFGLIIGAIVWSTIRLGALPGVGVTFLSVFASSMIIFQIFNAVDAVIIDWLILMVLWPTLGILPGTEHFASYRDPRMHITNFLKGIAISGFVGLITAGIAMGIQWVVAL
jgi:hypothetical protein